MFYERINVSAVYFSSTKTTSRNIIENKQIARNPWRKRMKKQLSIEFIPSLSFLDIMYAEVVVLVVKVVSFRGRLMEVRDCPAI